jgi:hypothetical protein
MACDPVLWAIDGGAVGMSKKKAADAQAANRGGESILSAQN